MRKVDLLIVGQGLAGAALAWTAHLRGLSVHLVDRGEEVTSSRVAAGLMMPITGKRLAKSWEWDSFWPVAVAFYHSIERMTGTSCLQIGPALRILQTEKDQQQAQLRRSQEDYQGLLESVDRSELPSRVISPRGAVRFPISGRLNVPAYLDATRQHFQSIDSFSQTEFEGERDLVVTDAGATVARLGIVAESAVLCRGFEGHTDSIAQKVCWNPAKGEIATVKIPGLALDQVVQFGHWLAPLGEEFFKLGATFSWSAYDKRPTQEGWNELELRLRSLTSLPYELVTQTAAVRPTICDFRPAIGWDKRQPCLGLLNGLGTKGSLMAPRLAQILLDARRGLVPLPRGMDFQRWSR
ncbi:MAG: FAD-binding oxidoreductase [Planctomycetaceae bacterium]|nr:FAD-binding oxidoreductase [Planctomycetaceae bacterium]